MIDIHFKLKLFLIVAFAFNLFSDLEAAISCATVDGNLIFIILAKEEIC